MHKAPVTRRQMIGGTVALGAAAIGACSTLSGPAALAQADGGAPFGYSFNTSTIRGQKLGLIKEIDIAIKAGYDGIEPWLGTMSNYVKAGGSLRDAAKRCADGGLKVVSAIGFAPWIVDDDAKRAKGLEQAKRDMGLVAQLGGTHIAAPPSGANRGPKLDLFKVAERYGALLKIGREAGVIPQVEVWGFSTNLSRLGEAIFVATESGHPDACVLPDIYHVYKGGSDLSGIKMLSRTACHAFHVNDYPADPPRETIRDEHRVFPGDGIAPLDAIFSTLRANRVQCYLSLELFNKAYWKQDPLKVAQTGLAKTKAAVKKALAA